MKAYYLQNKITLEIISKVNADSYEEACEMFSIRKCISKDEILKIFNII